MERFCNRCGTPLAENTKFCPSCGYDNTDNYNPNVSNVNQNVGSNTGVQYNMWMPNQNQTPPQNFNVQPQNSNSSYNYNTHPPIQPNVNNNYQYPMNNPPKKKTKTSTVLLIVIPIVAVLLALIVGAMGVLFVLSQSVVTKNSYGEKVFNFTAEKYVERYNKANGDVTSDIDFSDFEKDKNDDGDLLYIYSDIIDYSVSIVLFVGDDSYEDYVTDIKLNVEKDDGIVPAGAAYLLRGIYPKLSVDEACDILETCVNNYSGETVYEDVTINYEYDYELDTQRWYFYIDD